MATSGNGGGFRGNDQETGAPNFGDEALQQLEQRLQRHLGEEIDSKCRRFEERFDEIVG